MKYTTIKTTNKKTKNKKTKNKKPKIYKQLNTKQHIQNNKKYIFYIVDCNIRTHKLLNRQYLYNHLVNAGLIPDTAMPIIAKRYDFLLKKNGITKMDLCNATKEIKPLHLEDGLVKSNVFFYLDKNPILDNIFKYTIK